MKSGKPNAATTDRVSLFGTSGIIGVVGQDFTTDLCCNVARAIGAILPPNARVCVATDTRESREVVKDAVARGLRLSSVHVTDLGILPTPALAFLTRDMGFDTGIMITASHNPPEFNGIKLFGPDGIGHSRAQEIEIERAYTERSFRNGSRGTITSDPGARERYLRCLVDSYSGNGLDKNLKVVVDAGNGAASGMASELFSRLGLSVVAVNDTPDGTFPGRNPEPKRDTLGGTVDVMRKCGADLGVCFDGDADRVVFLDRSGFVELEEAIALVARLAVLKTGKARVATTVETGRFLDLALADLGVEVVRGRVGDACVAHLTRQIDAAIGVEPAGVYIMPEFGFYPESFHAALAVLSSVGKTGEIRQLLGDVPRLASAQEKADCPNSAKATAMARVEDRAGVFGKPKVNATDGLRFEYDDSWMLIRASGTEPLIRVSAESQSTARTAELLDLGVRTVTTVLSEMAA